MEDEFIFCFDLSTVTGITSADTGGYTVGPCPPDEELEKLGDAVDMSGADVTYSFWEFSLSIKIDYIIGYLTIFPRTYHGHLWRIVEAKNQTYMW